MVAVAKETRTLAKRNDKIATEDIPRLMDALRAEDPQVEQQLLRLLCPCRNRVYDEAVWEEIFRAFHGAEEPEVRNQAKHALDTLWQRSRAATPDPRARELLASLARRGMVWPIDDGPPRRRGERIGPGDSPRLLDALTGDDPDDREKALRLLCPCRNRRYDRELWQAIFEVYERPGAAIERDQAGHAIGTLRERARTDPRSQELLRWLDGLGVTSLPLEESIPVWRPRPQPGEDPAIPRWERQPRSQANRRRR